MRNEKFMDDVVGRRVKQVFETLSTKQKAYATEEDRFHNFKQGASALKTTPEKYLLWLVTKHWVAMNDLVDNIDCSLPAQARVDEHLGDIINYMMLLEGLILERRGTEEMPSDNFCEKERVEIPKSCPIEMKTLVDYIEEKMTKAIDEEARAFAAGIADLERQFEPLLYKYPKPASPSAPSTLFPPKAKDKKWFDCPFGLPYGTNNRIWIYTDGGSFPFGIVSLGETSQGKPSGWTWTLYRGDDRIGVSGIEPTFVAAKIMVEKAMKVPATGDGQINTGHSGIRSV